MSTTAGLPKCPRCGSIVTGHHECSQLGVSGVAARAVYEFWPPTGRRLDADFRRSWELLGELIAQLDRAYKLGGGVAKSNAPVAPEVPESRLDAPRYLLFSGDFYYPSGGWSDFRSAHNIASVAMLQKPPDDAWAEVVDAQELRVVARYFSRERGWELVS